MKYIKYLAILVFALLIVSFAPPGQRRTPTLPPKDPFGHIQWIQSVSYHAIMDSSGNITRGAAVSDSDIHEGRVIHGSPLRHQHMAPIEAWTYDEYGDQLEEDEYHSDNKLYHKIAHQYYADGAIKQVTDSGEDLKKVWKYTYKYDNSGNMLDSTEYYYSSDRDKPSYSRKVNVYNQHGKMLEAYSFNRDTVAPTGLTLYRYNDISQLIEIDESTIEKGNRKNLSPTQKTDFWYDRKGRVMDKATYSFHAGLIQDVKKTFDSTGYRVETYSYMGAKMPTGSVVKSFFKATFMLQEDTYNADNMLTEYTISHLDSDKHVMDKATFHINYDNAKKNDTIMVHHLVKDDHYNVVEDDHFANDGNTISHKSYQYVYDSIGNWTTKINFDDNKPVKIIEREIGYFKD